MGVEVQSNEMIWRFAHEDEQDNRIVISRHRNFATATGRGVTILLEEILEDWADNERGAWEPDSMLDVVVLAPPNMAGRYQCAASLRAVVVCYERDVGETG